MKSARYKSLSIEYLGACLSYDPKTGDLAWNSRPPNHFKSLGIWRSWNTKFAGRPAGTIHPNGRGVVTINSVRYYKSILCWALFYGRWPDGEIDHKDVTPSNDQILNLREASRAEQLRNTRTQKNNKSGYKNVSERWWGKNRYFEVRVMKDRKLFAKVFKSLDDAIAWAEETRQELHQDFARSR